VQESASEPIVGDTTITLVQQIIRSARTGDYAATASTLNRLLSRIEKTLSGGTVHVNYVRDITYSIETLAHMQQMGNWVAFADLLEYEFMPLWTKASAAQPPDNQSADGKERPAS